MISYSKAKRYQVLGCQWVFKYKTNKHGFLKKCKAKLMIYGNQQKNYNLPIKAITLATTFLRILLVVTIKFNLETLQLNVINAFVYAYLNKTVYM